MSDAALLAELEEFVRQLPERNHYEILGVSQDAQTADVRSAFHKLAKKFHIDVHPQLARDPDVRRKMQQAFGAINEAHLCLSNAGRREEYDASLEGEGTDVATELQQILRTEELFKVAKRLVERDELAGAAQHLEEALALNPGEPQFLAWLGWVRYATLEKNNPKPDRAIREEQQRIYTGLKRLTEKHDRVADGHLFRAHVARNLGEIDDAERHYRKVLELKPKHPVASTNLRLIRTRREQKKGLLSKLLGRK